MHVTSDQLLAAIENRTLHCVQLPSMFGCLPEIALVVGQQQIAKLVCLEIDAPRAWSDPDGLLVFIRASLDLRCGIDVVCRTDTEAAYIAAAIDKCLKDGHK